MRQLTLGVGIRNRASFATFQAAAAPEALLHLQRLAAGQPGIVWLYGPRAVGKSHLLQAVCAVSAPGLRVGYFPLAEMVTPAQQSQLRASLDGWQSLNICCVDDIDRAVGDEQLERALFSLYREIEEAGSALVVSALGPPASLAWRLADIGSRFGAAHIYRLRELTEPEQMLALRQRAQQRGLQLPDETIRYLQRRFPRDMRSLCEVLDRLDAASLAEQRRITVPFVRQVLGEPNGG